MKKFTVKAIAVALASVCGSAAFAGAITSPAASSETKYAVESLTATTAITSPVIVYTMGVARTPAQDFTVILTPSAGATFSAASCATATPVVAGGGAAATVSQKRSGTTECAYEVDITTASTTATTLTFTGLAFASHTLNVAGNTAGVTIALKDLGETAFIDNSSTLSRNVAISGNALKLVATADTATKADVNDEMGPLYGFVTVGDDVDAVAKAPFAIQNNLSSTWLKPDGTTPWDFVVDGTKIDVTIAGNFQGMATNGFTVTTGVGTAPVVTATAAGANATFTILPSNVTGVNTTTTVTATFTSARTASLGTSRTFGVSAIGDVVTGADVVLSGSSGWWVWGANASQLVSPYFSTDSTYLSRFIFLNTSGAAVSYSAQCYGETGNTPTPLAANGVLDNGTTVVNAKAICSFPGNTRGSIIFTVNAPINTVKGSYQAVNIATSSNFVTPLTRPYNQANTTE